jgi:hypothetical protein
VICNVRNQTHWVLATNYSGDTIYVNDPLYSQAMYQVGEVADGNSVVYLVQ